MNVMHLLRSGLHTIHTRTKPEFAQTDEILIRVSNLTRRTSLGDRIRLAGNARDRRKGLLGRKQLDNGEGLWIFPCEAVHTFGMQFAIDLVYLDRKHRVVKTRSQVHPGRLSFCLTAHSVIELATGTICKTQTMRGDTLVLEDQL